LLTQVKVSKTPSKAEILLKKGKNVEKPNLKTFCFVTNTPMERLKVPPPAQKKEVKGAASLSEEK
jgi:hypothetical protein